MKCNTYLAKCLTKCIDKNTCSMERDMLNLKKKETWGREQRRDLETEVQLMSCVQNEHSRPSLHHFVHVVPHFVSPIAADCLTKA